MAESARLAFVYGRVSTQRQADEGLSLDEQIRRCVERAEAEGWSIEVFADRGWSGARWDRPEFQRMLQELSRASYVITWKLDRLTRRTAHLVDMLDEFNDYGVGLVSLTEPFDGSTPMGRAMIEIAGVFAQLERSHNAERVRASATPRVERRRTDYGGGRRKYGRDRSFGIVAAEAQVIRERLVAPVIAGASELRIARELNDEGVPAPTDGGRWHAASIGKILRNPHLAGFFRLPGTDELLRGDFDPILDAEVWATLQNTLAARAAGPDRRGRKASGDLLLDKPVSFLCRCGAPMRPRGGLRYVCTRRLRDGVNACGVRPVDAQLIDSTVFLWIERRLDVRALQSDIERASRSVLDGARAALREAEREGMAGHAHLRRVEADYLEGTLSAQEYSVIAPKLRDRVEVAGREVDRLNQRVDELESGGALFDAEQQALDHIARVKASIETAEGGPHESRSEHVASVRAALARIVEAVVFGDLAGEGEFNTGALVGPDGRAAFEAVMTGRDALYLEFVPRLSAALRRTIRHDGVEYLLADAPKVAIAPDAVNSAFTSQNATTRPRRTTRSSS